MAKTRVYTKKVEERCDAEDDLGRISANLTRPKPISPLPFKIDACLKAVRGSYQPKKRSYYPTYDFTQWVSPDVPPMGRLSPEEAHFWIWICVNPGLIEHRPELAKIAEAARKEKFDGSLSFDEACRQILEWNESQRWHESAQDTYAFLGKPISSLYGLDGAFRLHLKLLAVDQGRHPSRLLENIGPIPEGPEGDAELQRVEALFDELLQKANTGVLEAIRDIGVLLYYYPKKELLQVVVPMWRDLFAKNELVRFHSIYRGLLRHVGDEQGVVEYCEKSPESTTKSDFYVAFKTGGGQVLGRLAKSALKSQYGRFDSSGIGQALADYHSPQMVAPLLELACLHSGVQTKNLQVAENWLKHEGANAVSVLIGYVVNRKKHWEKAGEILRHYWQHDHHDLIAEFTKPLSAEKRAMVDEVLGHATVETAAATEAPAKTKKSDDLGKWPAKIVSLAKKVKEQKWYDLSAAPSLKDVDGKAVPLEVVRGIVAALQADFGGKNRYKASSGANVSKELQRVFSNIEPQSGDRFTAYIFEQLRKKGRNTPLVWFFPLIEIMGRELTLDEIHHLLVDPYSLPRRSFARMLDCVNEWRPNGLALVLWDVIQRTAKDSWLNRRLRLSKRLGAVLEKLVKEAKEKSSETLILRSIPKLGFDGNGSLDLTYGDKPLGLQIRGVGEVVLVESGHPIEEFPSGRTSDEKYRLAKARYRETIQEIPKYFSTVTDILKMCCQETISIMWKASDWAELFLRHPILVVFSRTLIWVVSTPGKPGIAFRVQDDGTCCTSNDEPFVVPENGSVSVLTAGSQLSSEERAKWGEQLSDYKVLQPFDQLHLKLKRPAPPTKKKKRK